MTITLRWPGISFVSALLLLTVISSCNDENTPAASKKDLLLRTWTLTHSGFIRKDGVDVSKTYVDLSVSFQPDGTYTTTQAGELFSSSGTWITDEAVSSIALDGEVAITVPELSTTTLRVNMIITGNPSGGRGLGVDGEYDIQLHSAN
jgi:hypothetical protein